MNLQSGRTSLFLFLTLIPLRTAPRMATMQTMSKAPTTPIVTLIVNSLESFSATVVIPLEIGVIVAGDVESSTDYKLVI